MSNPNSRIIFPLDVPSLDETDEWCSVLRGEVGLVKVGLELFTEYGPSAVAHARSFGHEVMLDLKLHDIPATVGKAAMKAARLGAKFITVHASGGPAMLQSAVTAVEQVDPKAKVLAVTVLTSISQEDIKKTFGIDGNYYDIPQLVMRMGMMARESGVTGFVCSPLEVATLRRIVGKDAILVVPGVRPLGADDNDQKRVATPAKAMEEGADYLVVGRPIRHAKDPVAAARAIAEEIRPFMPD